jgi:hypothetical protein
VGAIDKAAVNASISVRVALVPKIPARREQARANVGRLSNSCSPAWAAGFLASFGCPHYHRHPADVRLEYAILYVHAQRYEQIATGYPSSPEPTIYIGSLLQKTTTPVGATYRYIIPARSNTVLYTGQSSGTNPIYYITKDSLGSTSVISDVNGALVLSENFSAQGIPSTPNWAGGQVGLGMPVKLPPASSLTRDSPDRKWTIMYSW